MPFETPRLDDRTFEDLVQEAMRLIPRYCPEWTDYNYSDPGITLIELFAWMTDILLYRLNRVPDKHFIKFMELVGMRLRDAEPARVPMTFYLTAPQPTKIPIYAGTVVSTPRTETDPAIAFTTDALAEIVVPKLLHVWTLRNSERDEANRPYTKYKTSDLLNTGLPPDNRLVVFPSLPPQDGDALYLGFEDDLSHHLIGIQVEVDALASKGLDGDNPPWIWEAFSKREPEDDLASRGADLAERGWERCWIDVKIENGKEIKQDTTKGFNEHGLIKLHLPTMQKATYGGETVYWLRVRYQTFPENPVNRFDSSPQISRMEIISLGITVWATNASIAIEEIVGRSDGTPGQRFYLEHTPIVPRAPAKEEYLVVRGLGLVDNGASADGGGGDEDEIWTEVPDFANSNEWDRHYTLDSLSGEIRLGPAMPQPNGEVKKYGVVPPKGAVLVMKRYRYGGGRNGNVSARTITQRKNAVPYLEAVVNHEPARGGRDAEYLDDAKLRVPGHMRSLERAVTAADYEYLAKQSTRGVERAHCMHPPDTPPGLVRLLVIPSVPNQQGYIAPQSLELSDQAREQIEAYLDERRLVGTQLIVTTPQYHWVATRVRVSRTRGSSFDMVRQAVLERLYGFLNPLTGGLDGKGWPFGQSLLVSDIFAELRAIPGIEQVRDVKLYAVNLDGSPILTKEGKEHHDEILVQLDGVIASLDHEVIDEEPRRTTFSR